MSLMILGYEWIGGRQSGKQGEEREVSSIYFITKTETMNRFWKAVILTWLFAGTADLTAAYISQWIRTGKFADKMLYYIAGGVLGLDTSMQGGNWVALLGLVNHYTIAFCATLFFFWVFPKVKVLWFDKWVIGAFYGIFVNVVVSLVINWLTPLPGNPFVLANVVVAWFILGLCLGIPIAYNAYRFYGVKPFKFRSDQ
jgi:hypothetical protein